MGSINPGGPGGPRAKIREIALDAVGLVATIPTGLKEPITVTRESGSEALEFTASRRTILVSIASALGAGASMTAVAKAVQADGAGVLIPVTLTGAAQGTPTPTPALSFSAGASAVRGVVIKPPRNNWTAQQDGLTPARSAALKFAGFNALRLWINGVAQMDAYAEGGSALADRIKDDIAYIRNAYNDGYAVIVSYAVDPYSSRLPIQNPNGTRYPQWMAICKAFGKALWDAFGNHVLFEPMNEFSSRDAILNAGYPDYYDSFCPAVVAAIRNSAPYLHIGLMPTDYGSVVRLQHFTDAGLLADDRVWFAPHLYSPGEVTHQGLKQENTFGINNLWYPVPETPGGKDQAIADMQVRVNNADHLTEGQKADQIAANITHLDRLFTPGGLGTPDYTLGLMSTGRAWQQDNGVVDSRILVSEFGMVTPINWDGTPGTYYSASAAYRKMVRQKFEEYGWGHSSHQALGNFNLFQQTSATVQGEVLVPGMIEALGMTVPAFTGEVTGLAQVSSTTESVEISFDDTEGATAYQYRLDNGNWREVPADKVITGGLSMSRSYDLQVRAVTDEALGSKPNHPLEIRGLH